MHARGGSQWQSRRKASLGPLRRAHPASGATWNVQVVRGKMTSRCLWHACRALVLGMVLMFVGGGMATVGYYANNFPSLSDLRSNSSTSTIRVKNEHRGLHLNNLSYVGPIIMGVGGFIVVASCVMTFEARDSAAKVVPARFKLSSQSNRNPSRQNTSRRSTGVGNGAAPGLITAAQTARWEQHLGVFRTSPATEQVPDRKALTAALVHFSKALGTPKSSPQQRRPSEGANRRVSRSGSVPNLYGEKLSVPSLATGSPANNIRSELLGGSGHRQHHHQHHQQHQHHRGTRVSSMVQRSTRGEVAGSGGLLHPGMLQFHRHALSVDEPDPFVRTLHQTGSHGSVQYGCSGGGEIVPVHKLREQRTKRSDTARRHVLSRQTKIEKDELVLGGSPKQTHHHLHHQQQQQQQQPPGAISRRASTVSNASVGSKQLNRSSRRASTISKTPSVDSRGAPSTLEINSPERSVGLTPRKAQTAGGGSGALISTPSVDRECRSQLSICSEPAQVSQRNLSCQSSLEPCVPEEDSPDHDETEPLSVVNQPLRPDSLVLATGDTTTTTTTTTADHTPAQPQNRFLYRSNSTKSFRKPKPKIAAKKRSNEYDQIYVIGAGTSVTGNNRFPNFYHHRDDDHYDSIEVIHERRNKNFSKFSDTPTVGATAETETETTLGAVTSAEPVGTGVTTESPTVITDSSGEYRKVGANTISVVADISPVPVSPRMVSSMEAHGLLMFGQNVFDGIVLLGTPPRKLQQQQQQQQQQLQIVMDHCIFSSLYELARI
ncbi:uncharacterized protein LOC125955658 [Anopheles darlingi]|uniref:uncharacterized protein LOC125955658 n=1 Tax=Anopheles darlingi TaxID=43151 RepID=UPI00210000ED|nr:uncharacterized protein LOC125955658 [Anopheles darlingi]